MLRTIALSSSKDIFQFKRNTKTKNNKAKKTVVQWNQNSTMP